MLKNTGKSIYKLNEKDNPSLYNRGPQDKPVLSFVEKDAKTGEVVVKPFTDHGEKKL